MNGSANEQARLRLDQGYINSIFQALTEFRNAGKRYKGTQLEEIFIQTLNLNPNGNNPFGTTPPNGEYWAFRRTDLSGVTNITYPTSFVNVASSLEFVNQSSAATIDAYFEAFDALIGDGQEIKELAKFFQCVPLLMWRARDGNDYWINSDRESQEGIDPYSGTVFNAYAQAYTVLTRSSFNSSTTGPSTGFLDNPNIGPGGIDYSVEPGVPSLARGMPPRPGEGTQRTIRKDSRNQ
jgi:type II secretory pathway pseudopilin PulG